jgi:putative membrane protein
MSTQAVTESSVARATIFGLSIFVMAAVAFVMFALPAPADGNHPTYLASLNALLNTGATVCLSLGLFFIKRKDVARHRASMLTAFGFSSVFLVSYLVHHAQVGSVPFAGEGLAKNLYFGILIPHILLATLVVPLSLFTIYRGWTNRIELHKKVAKVTLPIWLYVSVSGVVVYFMLYHL